MAIIKSKYKAPFLFRNAHVSTVLPSIFREVSIDYVRERISLAENDPFMPSLCYPYESAHDHEFFHLEVPKRGGHVGFTYKSLK